jgi:hypothetical protein
VITKRRIGVEADGRITNRGRYTADRERHYRKQKMRREGGRARSDLELYLELTYRRGNLFRPRWPGAKNGPARHDSIGLADGGW